ncbi:hypothetical protein IV203_028893 [Nitzschia inconspicua]|uniref:Uncharacterized protein n=1 Tax=Nitzschia inconspicua TaxID=303405 RepID=A0A9K3Q070_9STRA|nr:hypothetical protein IV203_028893 [Nitzschia inconspicua]
MMKNIFHYRTVCGIFLAVLLLCHVKLLTVAGFHHYFFTVQRNAHRLKTTNRTIISRAIQQQHDSARDGDDVRPENPSCRSPLFYRPNSNQRNNETTRTFFSWWKNALLATAVTVGATAAVSTTPAHASLDVSPGTTVLEISPELTQRKLIQTTAGSALKAARTLTYNQKEIMASLKRLQSAAETEVSSTQAWQELWSILQSYGGDLSKQVTIRPPSNIQQTLKDLVQEGKVNFIVNGEVVQVSLEYQSGKDGAISEESSNGIVPDDEWILRIEGYRGVDPKAIEVALATPKYDAGTPLWLQDFLEYCRTPYPTKYLSDFLIPSKEGQRPVTYGDILVLEGTLAVAFLYAWAYAFYLDEIERAEKATKAKTKPAPKKPTSKKVDKPPAKKTKGSEKIIQVSTTSTSSLPPPPRTEISQTAPATDFMDEQEITVVVDDKNPLVESSTVVEDVKAVDEIKVEPDQDIKVSIDFDSEGQMVITATENKSRDGVFAFLQALCFPWLGMLLPSLTAPETVVISNSDEEETEGLFPFLRALYFPWLGILQGK